MNPQNLLSQLNSSMQAGVPEPGQVSGTSPAFQPSLQPPPTSPMPEKSPASEITETALHRAFKRRQMPLPAQLQPTGEMAGQNGLPVSHPVSNMPPNGMQNDPSQPQPEVPMSEVELILKAMGTHIKHKDKMEEKIMHAFLPENEAQV